MIRSTLDADGVLVATIDMPGRTMNVFSANLMDALEALIERVETDPAVRGCVVTSGKSSFLAGADLVMVRGYCDEARTASHAAMFERCGRLGRLFVRLEESPKPWVAAVNGIALGGGLELALACRVRLVADGPRIQLGVPEVRWGLLPGAGGTQRLPRLAGFEPALDLLLTGRSIDPATAVRLGVFEGTVPSDRLLDDAKATARSLHGRPYDARAKFARPEQDNVPPHDTALAREIARRHGIGDDDFERYPAYSAIVDSVLKGARRTLAEATAIEMDQFLRLMFSPVAGRMVRTLFLERLRAERELAAPADVAVERVAVGEIGPALGAWTNALAKRRITCAVDTTLPDNTLAMVDARGVQHSVRLALLDDATLPETGTLAAQSNDPSAEGAAAHDPTAGHAALPSSPCALLSPQGPYGRVIEIVGADDGTALAVAALAQRLGALPWRTAGPASVLERLRGLPLDEQARIALIEGARPGAGDLAFIDVAACLAGVTPAWSGGPLTHLWSTRESITAELDKAGRAAWSALEGRLRRIFE